MAVAYPAQAALEGAQKLLSALLRVFKALPLGLGGCLTPIPVLYLPLIVIDGFNPLFWEGDRGIEIVGRPFGVFRPPTVRRAFFVLLASVEAFLTPVHHARLPLWDVELGLSAALQEACGDQVLYEVAAFSFPLQRALQLVRVLVGGTPADVELEPHPVQVGKGLAVPNLQ